VQTRDVLKADQCKSSIAVAVAVFAGGGCGGSDLKPSLSISYVLTGSCIGSFMLVSLLSVMHHYIITCARIHSQKAISGVYRLLGQRREYCTSGSIQIWTCFGSCGAFDAYM